jgi:phosphate transport system protein
MKPALAKDVVSDQIPIDALRRKVIGLITDVMICRQPMAIDFRELTTAKEMACELSHICRRAKRISERIIQLSGTDDWPVSFGFGPLAEMVLNQVGAVVTAYLSREVGKANQAWDMEKEIIFLDTQLRHRIEVHVDSHPGASHMGLELAACSHDLTAIAAHATRVAEAALFLIVGGVPGQILDLLPDEYLRVTIKKLSS